MSGPVQRRYWPACGAGSVTSDHVDDVPKTPANAPSSFPLWIAEFRLVFIFACSEIQLHSKQICVYFKRLEVQN